MQTNLHRVPDPDLMLPQVRAGETTTSARAITLVSQSISADLVIKLESLSGNPLENIQLQSPAREQERCRLCPWLTQ